MISRLISSRILSVSAKNELQAIKQTFEKLAAEAPQGSQLQDICFESARSAAAWSD